jgi:feruloyl-CoA synthase
VGPLRVAAIAAASPVIQDALVAGQDKAYVALLAWPNLLACRQLTGQPEATIEQLMRYPAIRQRVRDGLAKHNAAQTGSSQRIHRVLLMAEPPSIDGNELTDKGYINQRAALTRRAALVQQLYAEPPGPDVIAMES